MDIKKVFRTFLVKILFVFIILQGTSFTSLYAQSSFPNGEQGIFGPKQYIRTKGPHGKCKKSDTTPGHVKSNFHNYATDNKHGNTNEHSFGDGKKEGSGPKHHSHKKDQPNIYEDTFAATPGPGYLIIHNCEADSKHRVTSARFFLNNEQIYGHRDFKRNVYVLECPVTLNQTNTIRVELRGKPGTYLTVEFGQVLPSVTLSANPETILLGESTELSWSSTMADTCTIDNGIGSVDLNDSITVSPPETTIYTIQATAVAGITSESVSVTVLYPPEITVVEPDGIDDIADESFTITWTDEDPDSNAAISLYYDTDNTGADGTLITDDINEDPDDAEDQYQWDTSAIDQQDYYIYAVIDDGETPAVTAYSTGPVTVIHNTPPEITITSVEELVYDKSYEYIDSRYSNDFVYNWIDITAYGTAISLSDDASFEVILPFEFPFFNENKINKLIGSNGYLTFGSYGYLYSNKPIPYTGQPNDFIAPYWDDLNPSKGGAIHYYYDAAENRFIVQYTEIQPFSGSDPKTFQTILYPNGNILFQYKDMQGDLTSATVGIENQDGTDGLEIAYNTGFLENELAILIKKTANGTVVQWNDEDPDDNASISLYFDIDNTGADGVLIAEDIFEDPDGIDDQYQWNSSALADGTYYIYAVIDDGTNDPVVYYYPDAVIIDANSPKFVTVPEQQAMIGHVLTFSVGALDPNNDPLVYSATNLPEGATFDPDTQLFSWTPSEEQIGEFYPEFSATDGGDTATMTVKITVVFPPPVLSISADPVAIEYGGSSLLTWTSSYADNCTIEPDIGEVPLNGSVEVFPEQNTTYTITATGPGGTSSDSITVTIIPPIVSITADPQMVGPGESTTLSWTSSYADTCSIEPDIGDVSLNGSVTITPEQATTVYTITAVGPGGTVTDSVTVTVKSPVVSITAEPAIINCGEVSMLSWTSTLADTCTIEPDIGDVSLNGSISVTPEENITYTVSASGLGGTAANSVQITVKCLPKVSLNISPSIITYGESATLTWEALPAQKAYISSGIGEVATSGSMTLTPEYTTTYALTAVNNELATEHTISVKVLDHPPAPLPEGTFGEQYNDLIPGDASLETYDSERFIIITGLVQDIDGNPLQDVKIEVLNHPEYGSVLTDDTGRYSIPTEGGCLTMLSYEKQDYLPAHRKAETLVKDVVVFETVTLITQDPVSTLVTFDGNPNTTIAHKSTEVTDPEFGNRSCTMIFTGDNMAYEVDAAGDVINELLTITTRATEFTTPESMPAKLPPNSAYTYCVELSVDEVQRIKFEKPVITWINNFLGFDVGMTVPVGYYDRDQGVWVPSDNGIVVKLLDTNVDGIVDALDSDGDDQPNDLNDNGIFNDEVQGLNDPAKYIPGDTFWRVAVKHFTPWDCNWPYGPPFDAIAPNPLEDPVVDEQQSNDYAPEDIECMNSYVNQRSRVFHEDIPIPGTNITLHYASNRVEGYKTKIQVPVSGNTVPASLKQIIVTLEVAGRTFNNILSPLPNQQTDFIWDGIDYLGNRVSGPIEAKINIGYIYDGIYLQPNEFYTAFGQAGGDITSVQARQEIISWKRNNINLITSSIPAAIADGWSLSLHHQFKRQTLLKGDGTINKNNIFIIDTVAGNGEYNDFGDGGPATQAGLAMPLGLAFDTLGNMYIADRDNDKIRKVDKNGIITTFAGDGTWNYIEGVPATQTGLMMPWDVVTDAYGNVYIAQEYAVRKVDKNGIITTIAGTGTKSYRGGGDGIPAIQVSLNDVSAIDIDSSGNIYIAESYYHIIRKVDTNGIITTIAGTGTNGYSGDGGPASQAMLDNPNDIEVDAVGNLYIADSNNNRIRKVDTNGIITTIAGTGTNGYSGDGGPASQAMLYYPYGLRVDINGNVYFADRFNHRIRMVNTNGVITTIAGIGTVSYSGDGGPASQAGVGSPKSIEIDDSGNLYFIDTYRVRKACVPSAFDGNIASGETLFAESNYLGYIISDIGYHKETLDLKTGIILQTFDYNVDNELTSIRDQFNNEIIIERDDNNIPTAIISPDTLKTELTVNANNYLSRITYPDGSFYEFEYTPDGLMTVEIDQNGNRFEHYFDEIGRLIDVYDEEGGHWNYNRTTDPKGDITTEVLTGEGNLTTFLDHTYSTGEYTSTITGATGDEMFYSRSADGLTESKSLPCGMDTDVKYDTDPIYYFKYIKEIISTTPSGLNSIILKGKTYEDTDFNEVPDLITNTLTINGNTTTLTHNTITSQRTISSPEGRGVTVEYDPDTLLTSSVSATGFHDTTYEYYPAGDQHYGRIRFINTGTRTTEFTYDTKGNLASFTDPENQTTTYEYDLVGRVTTIYRPDATDLFFDYDNNGNMTVLTNPSDIEHNFGFNKVNLNDSYQAPLSGTYGYQYDKDRRLIGKTFPSGNQINNIYDTTRLIQVQTPEGNIDFTYLCDSKVDTVSMGAESIDYDYDGSLLTTETIAGTLNQIFNFTYNNDFYVESFTYAGSTEQFTYDNDGLLTGSGSYTITRNAGNGLPESASDGNLNIGYTFNGYGELEAQTQSVNTTDMVSWSLTRDNNGRITAKTETVGGITSNYIYTYDAMGRLETVTKDGTIVEEYSYDAVPFGTCTYAMNVLRGITGRNLEYNDEDQLLSSGSTTYQYNLDGFLTAKIDGTEETYYTYSSRGELLNVTLPDGRHIEYIHDPLGRRIAKKNDGVIVEKYLWQGMTKLLAVYDGSDSLLMRFEYTDGRMPVSMTFEGVKYYLGYDQVGTLKAVADDQGNVVKTVQYDSFGFILNDSDPSIVVPFGFAGGLYDRDTGLVRFGYRDYDPDVGRWTAKDPILFAGGDTDLYGYVLNDPVNLIDPLGLIDESVTQLSTARLYRLTLAVRQGQQMNRMNIGLWQRWLRESSLPEISRERLRQRIHESEGLQITYEYYLQQLEEELRRRDEIWSGNPCQ